MTAANWKTQAYNVVQSLLFNNPKRVIEYHVRDSENNWRRVPVAEYPKPQTSASSVESRVQISLHKLWHRVLCHRHPAPGVEHEIRNTGDDFLGVLFNNVPTGNGLTKLLEADNADS